MEVFFEIVRTSKSTLALALVQLPSTVAMHFELLAVGDDHPSNCDEGSSMPMLSLEADRVVAVESHWLSCPPLVGKISGTGVTGSARQWLARVQYQHLQPNVSLGLAA